MSTRKKIISLVQRALKYLENESTIGRSEVEALKGKLQNVASDKLPKVTLRDLSQAEIEEIFQVRKVTVDDIGAAWVPEILKDDTFDADEFAYFMKTISNHSPLTFEILSLTYFTKTEETLDLICIAQGSSAQIEASVRTRLDIILFTTLGFAKKNNRLEGCERMSWGQETMFSKDIVVSGGKRHIEGYPDYSLWYGDQRDMETNLVVVEAKTVQSIGSGRNQLLAYMGESWFTILSLSITNV